MDAFSRQGGDPAEAPDEGDAGRRRGPSLTALATATTAMAFVLVLLGVWTAVSGYGLTCDGRWPFCDGWMGLFPETFGSFVEWFHRFVAMLFGFAILGTSLTAWARDADRDVLAALGVALALTPLQVVFGAMTVLRYEPLELAAHFVTAVLILTLLVVGTVRHARLAPPAVDGAGLAAAALVGALALTPGLLVQEQGDALHVVYQGLALLAYVTLLAGAVSPALRYRKLRLLEGSGALLIAIGSIVGRVSYAPSARLVVVGCLVGAVLVAVATAWLAHADVLEPDRIGPAEF